jgi:hypothetical protein
VVAANDQPNRWAAIINRFDRHHKLLSVPYVEDEKSIFLKTIIPSSKATKKYLGDKI